MAAAEQKKSYQVIKNFRGVDTRANRTAIDENEFSWLENTMPIGYGNLRIIPNYTTVSSSGTAVTWANAVTYLSSANIGLNDYIVAFQENGGAQYYNVTTNTKGTIASAGTFSNAGVSSAQWKNERLMILDPQKGLFSWDGSHVVVVGSVGTIAITNAGTGYTSAPTVLISASNDTNGSSANAIATTTTANTVGSISLVNGGSGYYSNTTPTVSLIGGGGSGATAIAGVTTFATNTVSVNVVDGGAGYTNAANTVVSISGGGGSGATATAVVSGNVVTQVIMTNVGSNYTNTANLVVTVSGGGATTNATLQGVINLDTNISIATFSGRVWVAAGRTVYYSAAGSYSDFTSVSAGNVTLTDSTLHGNIQKILSANSFLYIFGDDSINVFSDVVVQTSGTTIFTNTNVSASVGSKRANAIFPYFRSVLFMNDYGVYALVGSTTSKISDNLDGIFLNIDFSYPVYGGQVLLYNILCAVFNFRYTGGQGSSSSNRYIQAIFFDKKWFFTNMGSGIKYITSAPINGSTTLFGTDGTNLIQFYSDSSAAIGSYVQTALLPLGDPIRTKQALKFGVEASNNAGSNLLVNVDSENGASPTYTLSNQASWMNAYGTIITWKNASNTVISWTQGVSYYLYKSDAQQWGKYLGLTLQTQANNMTINTIELEHELRARF